MPPRMPTLPVDVRTLASVDCVTVQQLSSHFNQGACFSRDQDVLKCLIMPIMLQHGTQGSVRFSHACYDAHMVSCRHTGAPGNPLTGLPLSCWHRLIVAGFHGFNPLLWAAVIQKAHIPFRFLACCCLCRT